MNKIEKIRSLTLSPTLTNNATANKTEVPAMPQAPVTPSPYSEKEWAGHQTQLTVVSMLETNSALK